MKLATGPCEQGIREEGHYLEEHIHALCLPSCLELRWRLSHLHRPEDAWALVRIGTGALAILLLSRELRLHSRVGSHS